MKNKARVQTWLNNVRNGNITGKTQRVLSCIVHRPHGIATDELRNVTEISHQTLTSILTNLHDAGLICVVDVVERCANVYSIYRFVEDEQTRSFIAREREREKMLLWIKRGRKDFDHMMSNEFSYFLERFEKKFSQEW